MKVIIYLLLNLFIIFEQIFAGVLSVIGTVLLSEQEGYSYGLSNV